MLRTRITGTSPKTSSSLNTRIFVSPLSFHLRRAQGLVVSVPRHWNDAHTTQCGLDVKALQHLGDKKPEVKRTHGPQTTRVDHEGFTYVSSDAGATTMFGVCVCPSRPFERPLRRPCCPTTRRSEKQAVRPTERCTNRPTVRLSANRLRQPTV